MIKNILLACLFLSCDLFAAAPLSMQGEEIAQHYMPHQHFVIAAVYENDTVLPKHAQLYVLDAQHCVIVARLNNESGFGGYEDIIYFHHKKIIRATKRAFASIFLDDAAQQKSKKIRYRNYLQDKTVQQGLIADFQLYQKQMSAQSLAMCR
ncbi:hypothetical protein [Acinetobacter larvae]|uniref:Uncharacterized protein n=1 Tax=Acinetobacter larvae TaxID=1789224 RepID=A0A1B2M2R7_9GAMM|nr:hypothetical protein [Acinetobacter larvae]AOA59482.1 hypothetical protein BFG52_14755 [Acinetobacter larvae]